MYGPSSQAEEADRRRDPVPLRSRLLWKEPLLHRLEEVTHTHTHAFQRFQPHKSQQKKKMWPAVRVGSRRRLVIFRKESV